MVKRYLIAFMIGILLSGCRTLSEKSVKQNDQPASVEEINITPDVVYGHKYGMALTFDVFQPKKQNGAGIIYINSGAWYSVWFPWYKETTKGLRFLTREELIGINKAYGSVDFNIPLKGGFTIFEVRHGSSPKFNMAEIVGDLRLAVRFIRFNAHKYGIDPDRLGLWGGSAGGHLALLLGTTSDIGIPKSTDPIEQMMNRVPEELAKSSGRVAAVVALCPPTELIRPENPMILKMVPAFDMKEEQYKEFSPINQASPDDPPTLLIHGEKDADVPISSSESMYQALLKAGVNTKFVTIQGAGHGPDKDADRILMETVNWFEENLKVK